MSTSDNSSKFWLQVKKEYIDDNIDALINYLSKYPKHDRGSQDYKLSVDALSDRVCDISEALANLPLYDGSAISGAERQKYIRLLIAHLIVCHENNLPERNTLAALCCLFEKIVQNLSVDTSHKLMSLCVQCVGNVEIDKLNVTWTDIKNADSVLSPVLAMKIAETTLKPSSTGAVLYYQKKGCLIVDKGKGRIAAFNYKDFKQHSRLEEILPSPCSLQIVGDGRDKLSKTASTDIVKTDNAYWETIRQMEGVRSSITSSSSQKHTYQVGDFVCVKLLRANDRLMEVQTVDTKYETIKGQVFVDKTILGLDRKEVLEFFEEKFYMTRGEVLLTVEVQDKPHYPFLLRNAVENFYRQYAKESYGREMLALCIDKYSLGHKWLTENGLTVNIMDNEEEEEIFEAIDFIVVNERKLEGNNCLINGEFSSNCNNEEYDVEEFKKDAKKTFLSEYIRSTSKPVVVQEEKYVEIPASLLCHCASALCCDAANEQETRQRHLKLSMANVLYTLVDDKTNAEYLRFELNYLMALVRFARGDKFDTNLTVKVNNALAEIGAVKDKLSIVDMLNNYTFDLQKSQETSSPKVASEADVSKIKKLVEASQALNGVISVREIDAIKQTIAKSLNVDDEYESIIEEATEFGEEDETREFKTSVVFDPSKTDTPNLKRQMKNILNAVCGFLNSDKGGDLYIGVNDAGKAIGVDKDVHQLYAAKEIKEESVDKYRLYIEYAIEGAFKDAEGPEKGRDITGLLAHTHIEKSEDGVEILRINIQPYNYGVAEFRDDIPWTTDEAKSYIRKSGRTVAMTESLKAQLQERRKKGNNPDKHKIQLIIDAKAQEKCVMLRGYESSSGISDRLIEPYYYKPSINAIVAYDVDKKSNREFKIQRFKEVEMTDEKWKNKDRHLKNPETDIFHIMKSDNQNSYKIKLEFDNYVKTLLFEEYPDARRLEESSRSDNRIYRKEGNADMWIMATTIFGFAGITRFYLGLANRIKILEGEELKTHIRQYVNKLQDKL